MSSKDVQNAFFVSVVTLAVVLSGGLNSGKVV